MTTKQAALEFLQNLPDEDIYKRGLLTYPPRGQADIAELCAEFADRRCTELVQAMLKAKKP